VTAWQSRPLEPLYPVVFFDALRVKIRDEATVRIKAVYLALAVLPDGSCDILGILIEQTEGAKFWMKVLTDLNARGCQGILIPVTDGLKGMEEAPDLGQRTCTSKLSNMLGTRVPVETTTRFPQGLGNRTERGFPQRPHASLANELYTQKSGHSHRAGHVMHHRFYGHLLKCVK
jgi:hypothetical protein